MTTLALDHLGLSPSMRDVRWLDAQRRRAGDGLAGRTVWCAAALPDARAAAQALSDLLRWAAEEGMRADVLEIPVEHIDDSDALVGPALARDDVVVVHDEPSAAVAAAARDRGAHVVWRVQAWTSLARFSAPAVDAYVMSWEQPIGRGGLRVLRIAALMPCTDTLAATDTRAGNEHVGWSSALANVVQADRRDHVGGTLHPKPAVAAR